VTSFLKPRPVSDRPIVFLHIPKTAGQTVHNQLAKVVGKAAVSPIRVHTQVQQGPQMPAGYKLYSGHLDWTEVDDLTDPFVFTVLRDPAERIASFYFYLLSEAKKLTAEDLANPANVGKAKLLENSAEDYFFGGGPQWRTFIHDHYDNFYCSYFATRKMRGWSSIRDLPSADVQQRALAGLATLDRIYSTTALDALEKDIEQIYGASINVAGNYTNAGPNVQGEARWPRLLALMGSDKARAALEDFAARDIDLIEKVRFAEVSGD
jgi:Sulfotransferase family